MNKKQRINWKEVVSYIQTISACCVIIFIVSFVCFQIQEHKNSDKLEELYQQCLQIQENLKEKEKNAETNLATVRRELDKADSIEEELEEIAAFLRSPNHYIHATLKEGELEVKYVENGKQMVEKLEIVQQELEMEEITFLNCSVEMASLEELWKEIEEIEKGYLSVALEAKMDLLMLCLRETEEIADNVEEDTQTMIGLKKEWDVYFERAYSESKELMEQAVELKEKEQGIADFLDELEATEEQIRKLPSMAIPYTECTMVELLSRLGNGEASICSDEEMQAVLQVALNRVKDSRFEDSLIGVIFEKNQYACTLDGNFAREYTQKSVDNAVRVLEGAVLIEVPNDVIFQSLESQGRTWNNGYNFCHYFGY